MRYRLFELSPASDVRAAFEAGSLSGRNSVARVPGFQPGCRGFESRRPLQFLSSPVRMTRAPYHPGVSETRFRDRDAIAVDLVGVAGISAFLVGLIWLRTSEKLGFDAGGALDGVLGQLAVTLPAAVLILGATALELAAGLVLARPSAAAPSTRSPRRSSRRWSPGS